jgi:hypothetical protein
VKGTLRVFENRVLRRIFGPKVEDGEDCMMTNCVIGTLRYSIAVIKSNGQDGRNV